MNHPWRVTRIRQNSFWPSLEVLHEAFSKNVNHPSIAVNYSMHRHWFHGRARGVEEKEIKESGGGSSSRRRSSHSDIRKSILHANVPSGLYGGENRLRFNSPRPLSASQLSSARAPRKIHCRFNGILTDIWVATIFAKRLPFATLYQLTCQSHISIVYMESAGVVWNINVTKL